MGNFKKLFLVGSIWAATSSVMAEQQAIGNTNSEQPKAPSSVAKIAPPALDVNANDELVDTLDEYIFSQEAFLNSIGKNYQMSYGVADINGTVGTESYVLALESAYALALNNAYGSLARTIGAEKISKEVETRTRSTEGTDTAFTAECSQAIADRRRQEKADGYVDGVLTTLAALSGNNLALSRRDYNGNMFRCSDELNSRSVSQITKSSVEEVFTGTRIFQSVIKGSQIGVVVGYSPDTAEVAAVLASQNASSQPIPTALLEIRDWVSQQIESQEGSKLGLFGSRMKRLSNGEWAVVGFAVAPHFESAESGGLLQRQRNASMRDQSKLNASSELAKFANLNISFSRENKQLDSQTERLVQEIKYNSDREESTEKIFENVLASQMDASSRSSSELELRGAKNVFSKKITDEALGVSFYLSAHAWSPSMLGNINKFNNAIGAAKERGSVTTGSETNSGQSSGTYTSAPVISEDW